MASKAFNAVDGVSVGVDTQINVIDSGGNVTAQTLAVSISANFGSVDNLVITGGESGQFLQTDGSGNLIFADPTVSASGSNTQIQFNDDASFGASANLTFDKSTNTLVVKNSINIGGADSNISGANNVTANFYYGDGGFLSNISGAGSGNSITNGTSNVVVDANSNVRISVADTANVFVITATGANLSGNLGIANGNVTGANLITANSVTIGNGTGGNLTGANVISANTLIAALSANLGNSATSNFFIGDGGLLSNVTAATVTTNAQPNITSVGTLSSLAVTGNVTAGNFMGILANGTSNISIPVQNGNINLYSVGNIWLSAGNGERQYVFNNSVMVFYSTGTLNGRIGGEAGSFSVDAHGTNIAPSNLTLATIYQGYISFTTDGNERMRILSTGNVGIGTSTPTSNLHVIGTANVTGNATAANFVGNHFGNGAALSSITGANVTGTVSAATTAGTVTTAAQPNITSIGNLTTANITTAVITTGNITTINSGLMQNGNSNVVITANGNVTISAVGGARITATSAGANVTGTLGVSGNANVGNIGATIGVFTGNISSLNANLGNFAQANYINVANDFAVGSGSGGNIIGANLISANFFTGTLTTAAQPNITSVGTLTSLAVTGNVTANNVIANYYYGNGINLTGIVKAIQFFPASATYPSANYATYQSVSGTNFPVNSLAFDANTEESVFFNFNSDEYSAGNVQVDIQWYASTATSGNVVWGASLACITPNSDTQDITTKAFGAETLMLDTHLGTTGKRLHSISANLSNVDGIATSDWCVLKIARKAANVSDTMAGDALVVAVDVTYIN